MIKLLIVEDNINISEALEEYFSMQDEFQVIGKATSVEDLLKLPGRDVDPQIILLDIMLQGMTGIAGLPMIFRKWPDAKVVINSVLEESDIVYEALKGGALGYVTKDMPLNAIKDALLMVNAGGSFMNARIARQVVNFFQKERSFKEVLTDKEWSVAIGIKEGKSYKMIASECEMSIDGVRFYIQKIYRKLNVNSRGELAAILHGHK